MKALSTIGSGVAIYDALIILKDSNGIKETKLNMSILGELNWFHSIFL